MANKKISELPAATAPDGSELVEIVQGGINKQATVQDLADLTPDGWLATGTTEVTDPIIDIIGQLTFLSTEATIDIGNTPNGVLVLANQFKAGTQGDEAYIQISGTTSADILITAADDINIAAGQTGSGHDVNITSNYGHTHITTGDAGVLLTTTGPLTVNADTGSSGEVLTSNGAVAAPTWQDPGAVTVGSITGAVSLGSSDLGKLWLITGTTSAYTVDLPTAVGNDNLTIILKGSSLLTQNVTIAGISGQTIDGESTRTLGGGGSFTLLSDGANWQIVNEVGSWITYTPVWGGFSADPTVIYAKYFRIGKMCTVRVRTSTAGTSDATTTTVTVPFAASSTATQLSEVAVTINSGTATTTGGFMVTRVGNSTVDVYRDHTGAAWTASGSKRIDFTLIYEVL